MNMRVAGTKLPDLLLDWYDRHRRDLPWRAAPGERIDPYRVWLSEIMLQQTTVAAVAGYFQEFTQRWPTVRHLAAAELDDVLQCWAGLGYYARARNLHRCARIIVDEHAGTFPDQEDALLQLPGVGPYTAAAIAAIAFGRPAAAVDGNIERVIARVFTIDTPLPDAKPEIRSRARSLVPADRPGDYTQAMMDLGATVCTPRRANCLVCPLSEACQARAHGVAHHLPKKRASKARPTRHGRAFWIERSDGAILMRRRKDEGLLGGMMEVPSTAWCKATSPADNNHPSFAVECLIGGGSVEHTFTHFHLELEIVRANLAGSEDDLPDRCRWVMPEALSRLALPSVMKKVVVAVLGRDAFKRQR